MNNGEWAFDDPEDDQEPDQGCHYGISEFCVDGFARATGCTVNCNLYLETVKRIDKNECT